MQREKVSWDGIKDRVEQTIKVAHVTFYLVREDEDSYLIFSESPRESLDLMRDPRFPEDIDERFFYGAVSYNDALIILQEAIVSLEGRLERKRDGMPTPRQLAYLFRHKIPIPLTLTWGQASDIIDEKIAQIAKEKQDKVQAKRDQFHGFLVKDRVSHLFTGIGKRGEGTITKLWEAEGSQYIRIDLDKGGILQYELSEKDLANLQKVE